MSTRIGKIAQLPKSIRDDLNQRLQNGKQGPELLKWLNGLPETQDLVAAKFDHQPINRQNLTEWRHGGYEDWLHHQEREQRIQRFDEEGTALQHRQSSRDPFENTARIALAELMADIDDLHHFQGEDRWKRLRALTQELARLQNAYNRGRWRALAWIKWNDRFLGAENYAHEALTSQTRNTPYNRAEAPSCTGQGVTNSEPSQPLPQNPTDSPEIKPIQTNSIRGETEEEVDDRVYIRRTIYHHPGCGCICKHCHPEDSDYTYGEALEDQTESKKVGALAFWRGRTSILTRPTECHCPCEDHAPAPDENLNLTSPTNTNLTPEPHISPMSPISPIPYDPGADFRRMMANLKSRCSEHPS